MKRIKDIKTIKNLFSDDQDIQQEQLATRIQTSYIDEGEKKNNDIMSARENSSGGSPAEKRDVMNFQLPQNTSQKE